MTLSAYTLSLHFQPTLSAYTMTQHHHARIHLLKTFPTATIVKPLNGLFEIVFAFFSLGMSFHQYGPRMLSNTQARALPVPPSIPAMAVKDRPHSAKGQDPEWLRWVSGSA